MAEAIQELKLFTSIASVVNSIAPFNGNREVVLSFTNAVDGLIPLMAVLNHNYRLILLGFIKRKILGIANETLLKYKGEKLGSQ